MKKIKTTVNRFTNTSLHEKALSNAVKLLNAIGVEYAIQDHDGTLHGNGVLQTKAKRKPLTYPYGSLSKHVRPYVDACGINQTVTTRLAHQKIRRTSFLLAQRSLTTWTICSHN